MFFNSKLYGDVPNLWQYALSFCELLAHVSNVELATNVELLSRVLYAISCVMCYVISHVVNLLFNCEVCSWEHIGENWMKIDRTFS